IFFRNQELPRLTAGEEQRGEGPGRVRFRGIGLGLSLGFRRGIASQELFYGAGGRLSAAWRADPRLPQRGIDRRNGTAELVLHVGYAKLEEGRALDDLL